MSDLPRTQHILASGLVAVIGVSVAIISYTQTGSGVSVSAHCLDSVRCAYALDFRQGGDGTHKGWQRAQLGGDPEYAARAGDRADLCILGGQGAGLLYGDICYSIPVAVPL